MTRSVRYIPALRFKWLTPLYDPLLKWVMREESFKLRLIHQTRIQPGMNILDLGCGTGTLTIMMKNAYPDANITGMDVDPQVLDLARRKSQGTTIQWDQAPASSLHYPDSSFERVVTSLVIHHLATADKRGAFHEIHRVLKPQGELHVLDFGKPHSLLSRFIATYMRHLEQVADNFDGLIPRFIAEAGFDSVIEAENFITVFGPLSLWRAVKGS